MYFVACEYNGVLVEEGVQIKPNCSSHCTCHDQKFQCETLPCLVDGPTCSVAGESHYQTFDLRYFDFQGDCEYILTTPCDSDEFSVVIRNGAHNEHVSSVDQVTISVPSENLVIVLGRGGTVTVNGVQNTNKSIGVIYRSDKVEVLQVGGHPQVTLLEQPLKLFWDGLYRVEVTTSSLWKNKLCGLCGNYNDNPSDDFMDQDGNPVDTAEEFGNSWATGDTSSCGLLAEPPFCVGDIREQAIKRCDALTSAIFGICNTMIDPIPFHQDCIFDYCNCNDEDRDHCYCESLATYASACAADGISFPSEWRKHYGCCK